MKDKAEKDQAIGAVVGLSMSREQTPYGMQDMVDIVVRVKYADMKKRLGQVVLVRDF